MGNLKLMMKLPQLYDAFVKVMGGAKPLSIFKLATQIEVHGGATQGNKKKENFDKEERKNGNDGWYTK